MSYIGFPEYTPIVSAEMNFWPTAVHRLYGSLGGPNSFGPTIAQYFPFKLILQYIIIIISIIIIIIQYECLLSQAFSSRYFSWTSSDPYRSGFKLHTAVLSVVCVTFQV